MATLARTELLGRKIDKHMRAYVDEMRHFRNELQSMKATPKRKPPLSTKEQRPLNDANKKLAHNSKPANMSSAKPLKKLPADGRSLNTNYYSGDKMTNNKTVSGGVWGTSAKISSFITISLTEFATSSVWRWAHNEKWTFSDEQFSHIKLTLDTHFNARHGDDKNQLSGQYRSNAR